jgi:DNA topoisomerase-1
MSYAFSSQRKLNWLFRHEVPWAEPNDVPGIVAQHLDSVETHWLMARHLMCWNLREPAGVWIRQPGRSVMPAAVALSDVEQKAIEDAGLHRIETSELTIERVAGPRGFDFLRNGKRPVGRRDVRRITELAIPPAWVNVRIASDPDAHLQAVGRDQAGRLQYIYHGAWEDVRAAAKAFRLIQLGQVLAVLRRGIDTDLEENGAHLAFAAAARLVDVLHLRAGHESYAGEEGGRGVATLLKRHVQINGSSFRLCFRGKGGKRIDRVHADERLAAALDELRRSRGQRLFQIKSADSDRPMTATDLNAYLGRVSGKPVTAKDFRTLYASAVALDHLSTIGPPPSQAACRRAIAEIARTISAELANTPAVTRKSYIHPLVIERFEISGLADLPNAPARMGLTRAETKLIRFLESSFGAGGGD